MIKKEKIQQAEKWHSLDAEVVIEKLKTDQKKGLDKEEATARIEKFGKNELPKGKKRSALMRLLLQFHNVLIYVLLIAALITGLMEHWIDTGVILAVVIINALIGFIQEGKAEKALESIKGLLSLEATVIRGGEKWTIDAEELVPGDVVMLESGDKVPADIRLLEAKNLRIEESPLTGESTSVEKSAEPVEEDAVIGDKISMAFSGTVVTYGKATGIVVSTGSQTEIGKIKQMVTEVEEITTPLLKKIERFGKWLAAVIILFTGLFFAFGYFFRDYTFIELLMASISLIVASIPEGLPAIMTIALAIGVQRMASRNAIIRRLPSVETLGSVSVICVDKTGTLTRNEMTAKKVIIAEKEYEIEGVGYRPEGNILHDGQKIDPKEDKVLWQLLKTIRVCNNSEVHKDEDGNWQLTGTPTEGALLTLSYKAGLQDFKPENMDTVPFESDHKYMATLNKVDNDVFVFIKGAPEKIIEMCSKQYTSDGEKDLDNEYWQQKMKAVAAGGQRLLGVAFGKTDNTRNELKKDDIKKNNILLGLVGIIDPPRDEAIEAVKECKRAGIKVKMITGDHILTATAIGKEIGIGDGEKAISGKELEEMNDEELRKIAMKYDVYARTSPEHKLRLVKALQENGLLCAMTGDGVNDAPALKKANIGIAMGIKGTEVSKDASEMVLADDNFTSIVNAIEEGRTVYDNLRKTLLFLLPANGAEALVLMAAVLLGIIMPITPVQILWVNMVSAVTLALALTCEPMEEEVMERPPRKPDDPILGKDFLFRIVLVSFLSGGLTFFIFNYMQFLEIGKAESRTVAVNTLVTCHLFYLFACRKIKRFSLGRGFFDNKCAFVAAFTLILFQISFVYASFMNEFFETAPIEIIYWAYPLAAGFIVFWLVELKKFVFNKLVVEEKGVEKIREMEEVKEKEELHDKKEFEEAEKKEKETPSEKKEKKKPALVVPKDYALPDFSQWGEVERISIRSARRTPFGDMQLFWSQIPHVTYEDEADITNLEVFRRNHKAEIEKKGGALTLTVFIIKAAVAALKSNPLFNAGLDTEQEEIVLKHYYNIGLAVDTDQGLLVPVIREADCKSITDLAIEISVLADKTRKGKFNQEDLISGSFTIINIGSRGGTAFRPIIQHHQAAVLSMVKARLKPMVMGDINNYHVKPRLMLPLTLGFDQRIADGSDAVRFMEQIVSSLENPEKLMMLT
jgi:P-type Ca2+ transporter type 2C